MVGLMMEACNKNGVPNQTRNHLITQKATLLNYFQIMTKRGWDGPQACEKAVHADVKRR